MQLIQTQIQNDQAFDERTRKIVGSCAAVWTVLGATIAVLGILTTNVEARPLVFGSIAVGALAGIGATIACFQGIRLLAIAFILLTLTYPTYFIWVHNLVPLVLAGYLVFLRSSKKRG